MSNRHLENLQTNIWKLERLVLEHVVFTEDSLKISIEFGYLQ